MPSVAESRFVELVPFDSSFELPHVNGVVSTLEVQKLRHLVRDGLEPIVLESPDHQPSFLVIVHVVVLGVEEVGEGLVLKLHDVHAT